ncbi:hypothetical protein KEM54_005723 [Ascosphaera aggregata]|nr:hypothetical protein KEM54_005723 [Ascosphaera aggregata]
MADGSASGQRPIDEFVSLIQNPFKSAFQVNAVWVSLGVSLGVTITFAALFSLLRPKISIVYAPKARHADRKHQPPPISSSFFGWWKPVVTTKEEDVIDQLGLDATIFLRFTRMCRNMFLVLSVLGCAIMIPVNIRQSDSQVTPKGLSVFTLMTPMYVFDGSLWSHVACSWAFDAIVCGFLWWTYRTVVQLRKHYFASPEYRKSLHARTVLVRHIPRKYRTDEGLLRITDKVNPTTSIPRAAIGRNVMELPVLFEEHEETVKKLEKVLAEYFKKPDRLPPRRPLIVPNKRYRGDYPTKGHDLWGRPQVDAIDYLTDRIKHLEVEIKLVREKVDKRNAMSYGFASWKAIESAHVFAHAAEGKHPLMTSIQLAPKPNDLIWENLDLNRRSRRRKKILNIFWSIALTVLYIGPNALIAIFLTDLSNLGNLWKPFQVQLKRHPKIWAAVQGVAAPAVTALVYLALPSIFRRLAIKAGDITKTSREQHVIGRLYAFFVFNNLFVFSVFSAVSAFVMSVVTDARHNKVPIADAIRAGHFFVKVMTTLCQISPFWVTYLLQRNLGSAIDLIQLVQFMWKWFRRRFKHPTPRDAIEWTAPPPFQYAMYYNYFLFYSTIGLSFATLQPVVLPVTALYFFLECYIKKYLLLYVYVTKTESGGLYWRPVFNRCIFACIFANFVTALVVRARGSWIMVYALVPLPVAMILFKLYCKRAFDADLLYIARKTSRLNIVDVENEAAGDKSSNERLRQLNTRFGHPVFYKQFMTPMVHAKAAEALETILEARTSDTADNGFAETVDEYSDIALHNLDPASLARSKDHKRKSKRKTAKASGFEVIAENELDYAYFKERPEFREEYAGEGGMYWGNEDHYDRSNTSANPYFRGGNGSSMPSIGAPLAAPGYDDGSSPPMYNRAATGLSNTSGAPGAYTHVAAPANLTPYAHGNAIGPHQSGPQQTQAFAPYRNLHGMAPTLPDVGAFQTPSPSPGLMGMGNANASRASLASQAALLENQEDYFTRGPSPTQTLLGHGGPSDIDSMDYHVEAELQGMGSGVTPSNLATSATPLANDFENRNRRSVAEFDGMQRGQGNYNGGGYRGYRY